MLFNSIEFLIFLPLVFFGYWFVFKSLRWQNLFVVAVSYLFYGWWDWRFLLLILFTSLCSYLSGVYLEKCAGKFLPRTQYPLHTGRRTRYLRKPARRDRNGDIQPSTQSGPYRVKALYKQSFRQGILPTDTLYHHRRGTNRITLHSQLRNGTLASGICRRYRQRKYQTTRHR